MTKRKYIEMSRCNNPKCWCGQQQELEKMFEGQTVIIKPAKTADENKKTDNLPLINNK